MGSTPNNNVMEILFSKQAGLDFNQVTSSAGMRVVTAINLLLCDEVKISQVEMLRWLKICKFAPAIKQSKIS